MVNLQRSSSRISGSTLGLLALLVAGSAAAQTTYPEKPIRLVVGFPPGSGPDTVARLLGQKFAAAWGQPDVIYNVTSAAGYGFELSRARPGRGDRDTV